MFENYIPIIILGIVTALCGIGFYLLEKLTFVKRIPYWYRQIFYGLLFGGLAVLGTEFGSDIGGAVINVRDAAPLTAGLIFGGPAGIIAGVIGGVERFFAAYWYRGSYTQIACSVSTLLAGFIAAGLRKWMFDKKAPNWVFGVTVGVVMEVFHLFLIFITHIAQPYECLEIIRIITFPMIIANAAVLFVVTAFIDVEKLIKNKGYRPRTTINRRIQFWMLVLVVSAAGLSNIVLSVIQNNFANETANSVLVTNLFDVDDGIFNYMNEMIDAFKEFAYSHLEEKPNETCAEVKQFISSLLSSSNVSTLEINYVSEDGIVKDSTDSNRIGYDMRNTPDTWSFHECIIINGKDFNQAFTYVDETEKEYIKYGGTMFTTKISDAKGYKGYIQLGMKPETINIHSLSSIIDSITNNRRVYANGYCIIFDYKGHLISNNYSIDDLVIDINTLAQEEPLTRQIGKILKYESTDSFYMYGNSETYYVVAAFPVTDLTNSRDATLYLYNFISIIIYAVIFIITYHLVDHNVVKSIHKINDTLSLITKGDLSQKANVDNTVEFFELSTDINFAVDTLKSFIEREAKRIDEELAFARKVQASSLPNVFPPFPGIKSFDIYASMNPAKEVGGDFYDFFLLSANLVGFLVADVSGKGIPASMFMMESKAMLKNNAILGLHLEDNFKATNYALCQGNDANMFVTCWMGILDLDNGQVVYCNAGHNSPIIYRHKEKKWVSIKQKKNMVLAGLEDVNYQVEKLELEPGDRIFLYTDGVTEATRRDGALYKEERLLAYLNAHQKMPQKELLDGIRKDIDTFIDGADQFDDITMLIVDYKGN